jgi:hypothetical protein
MATILRHGPAGELIRVAKVRVDYTELVAAAATQAVDLVTLPDNAVPVSCWIENVVAMTDSGSISACTVQVGVTAVDTDAYYPAFDLFGATGRKGVNGAAAWLDGDGRTVTALFTATGANLGNGSVTSLDTGVVDVTMVYMVVG